MNDELRALDDDHININIIKSIKVCEAVEKIRCFDTFLNKKKQVLKKIKLFFSLNSQMMKRVMKIVWMTNDQNYEIGRARTR